MLFYYTNLGKFMSEAEPLLLDEYFKSFDRSVVRDLT